MNRATHGLALAALVFLSLACGMSRGGTGADAARGTERASTQHADTGTVYLPGLVSTPDHDEGGLHLTAFGETYFWRRRPGEKQRIYVLDSLDGTAVASFSTDRDENPHLTRDGLTLYFGSERPIPGRPNLGNFDMNLWVTRRDSVGAPWAAPAPLPPGFNRVQAAGETWPTANVSSTFSLDDTTFYVSTQPPGDSATRLYVYRRDATDNLVDPQRIEGLFDDPRYSIGGATLSPDGAHLFFNSYGAPGGGGDPPRHAEHRARGGGRLRLPGRDDLLLRQRPPARPGGVALRGVGHPRRAASSTGARYALRGRGCRGHERRTMKVESPAWRVSGSPTRKNYIPRNTNYPSSININTRYRLNPTHQSNPPCTR